MSEFWNQRFSEERYVYGQQPNEFLKQQLKLLTPGRILFPCEGEGRNAVFAALKGWEVDAFDGSEEGKKKALKLANDNGVKIQYDIINVEDYVVPNGIYDAVVLVFAHFTPSIRSAFHQSIINGLKRGGVLILVGFRKEQLGHNSGGPRQLDMLFDQEMLQEDFRALKIDHLAHAERILDEGPYHQGLAYLIQLVGYKH